MCGIVGVLNLTNPEPVGEERLRAGNDALFHRGPDDGGVVVRPGVALATRRLSIVDLDHGHQPMSNETGTVHIAYNGEVYNHAELRRGLESRGHTFRTHADTEALLHGYEEWGGEGLLSRLRGMFAFAVWDDTERTLFVARDRMGIKPLYYAQHDGRFYFASEIRALLLHSGMPRRVHLPALDTYMTIGFVTAPHTMFEGVRKLPPAHCLRVRNGVASVHRYWELSYDATHRGSAGDIVDEFRARFQNAVDSHLMSDVPLGALLSGGVDSTATAAFMRRTIASPFKTINIGFEDGDLDEAAFAAESARELGTEHHSIRFTGDSMADYPTILRHLEEPFGRPTHAALFHVFRACHEQGLKVVMTGEGADELLGGYSWHRSGYLERLLSRLPLSLRNGIERSGAFHRVGVSTRNLVRTMRGVPKRAHERYLALIRLGEPALTRSVYSASAAAALNGTGAAALLDEWSQWMGCVEGRPEFDQILWIQSRTRMSDYINHGLDRMSMAHSVEARPPFLDHELWEFCASIPTGLKMRHATEKHLLRECGRGIVPEAARVRPKAPLRVPYPRWVAQARLPEWAETSLSEAQVRKAGVFDPSAVSALRRDVQAGAPCRATLLMCVLNFQLWAHLFIETPLEPGTLS